MEEVIARIAVRLEDLPAKEARVGASTPNRVVPDDGNDANAVKPDRGTVEEYIGRIHRLAEHLNDTTAGLNPGDRSAVAAITKAICLVAPHNDPVARTARKQVPRGYDPITILKKSLSTDEALRLHHAVNMKKSSGELNA